MSANDPSTEWDCPACSERVEAGFAVCWNCGTTEEGTADPDGPLSTFTVDRSWTDDDPVTGMRWDEERGSDADVYYVRVRQAADSDEYPGMAWAGPIWVEAE